MATTKKKKAATKKRAVAKPKDNSTEIVFSHGEIDFLRKITGKDADGSTPKNRRARLSLRDKLLDINFGAPEAGSGLIVLALMRPAVEFLQRTTKRVRSIA